MLLIQHRHNDSHDYVGTYIVDPSWYQISKLIWNQPWSSVLLGSVVSFNLVDLTERCFAQQVEDALELERKHKADLEKSKRKLEADLRAAHDTITELEKDKAGLEDNLRK